jgi:nucleoside-diphosphate-sugar epimerase
MPPDLVQQYQNYTQAVMTKLRSAGSDTPTTSLEAGVKQTVDWLNAYAE